MLKENVIEVPASVQSLINYPSNTWAIYNIILKRPHSLGLKMNLVHLK